jgi:EAL domain-containing protein (putative c-di-GMP-specific phosphodiesterase class I)
MTDQRQTILIADDDDVITDALSLTLERDGRTVILCSDVDAAEVALSHFPVTHVVTDVQFTGEFGFEGLHFVDRIRALAPQSRIVIMTGNASEALRRAALDHGAAAVLAKPFLTGELEEVLSDGAGHTDTGTPYEIIRIPSVDEILGGNLLTVAFQPIVQLAAGNTTTFAYEGLTRGRGEWPSAGPTMLFEYAQRRGKLAELNIAAMQTAIAEARALPDDAMLFINIDPLTFSSSQLVPSLHRAATRAGIALDRIVLEITERCSLGEDTTDVFEELRAAGVRFALDDHGSAYSHLLHIGSIRPSFIKISHAFGTAFEQDETRRRIVRNTMALARDFGCEVILEGIESGATAAAAIEKGVRFGQGFYFSRARAASHWAGAKTARWAA